MALNIKRLVDIVLALVCLVIFTPILLGVSGAIYLIMGHPVLFTQLRPGKNACLFRFYKFRTMMNLYDSKGNLLADEKRLTRLGKFLRATSLDELPQLWNVLKGDMSFVGPRPLLVEYLDRYSAEQARRHEVKPGITGWAQVNGRNRLSWEEKFKLDVWYVDHWNLWLDLKILGLTLFKVLRSEGISHNNHATMSQFQGGSSLPD